MAKKLYFGMGQSNAVEGARNFDLSRGLTPVAAIYPGVTQYLRIGSAEVPPIVWEDLGPESLQPHYPIGAPAQPRNQVGHSIPMGHALANWWGQNQVVMGRCAVSGTSIEEWLPDAAPPMGETDNLYTQAVDLLDTILTAETAVLTGIWWTQGNSDANLQVRADAYAEHLGELFAALRADVGIPTLRICYDQLPPAVVAPFVTTVRAQQAAYALTDPYARMIPTDASYALRDADHYTADSFWKLGWNMANAFLDIFQTPALNGDLEQ